MNKKFVKKVIAKTPTSALVDLSQRSKFSLLAEKFLLAQEDKTHIVLTELGRERKRLRIFWRAIVTIPIVIFIAFLIPQKWWEKLTNTSALCRFSVGLVLGCLAANPLIPKRGFRAILAIVPTAVLISFLSPNAFFSVLLGSPSKLRCFYTIGCAVVIPTIAYSAYLFSERAKVSIDYILGRETWNRDDELQRLLQQALEHVASAHSDELAALVKDYAPEYRELLSNLRDVEVQVPLIESFENEGNAGDAPPSMKFPVFIGRKEGGRDVYIDLDDSPHMLVAGCNGSGKTNFIEVLLCWLLDKGNCKIVLVDPTDNLYGYASNPNVTYTPNIDAAKKIIGGMVDEIKIRSSLFRQKKGVRKISDWVADDRPPRLFLFIEEFKQFSDDKVLVKEIEKIAGLGRKYGIHCILATQTPHADVFSKDIKHNMNWQLAFRAASKGHAQVLGETLALQIPEKKKGLAVFQKEFVQTSLLNNRRWWDDNADPPGHHKNHFEDPMPTSPTRKLVAANREDEQAFFMSIGDYIESFGSYPTEFPVKRSQVNGVRKKGVWLKWVVGEQKESKVNS